MYRRIKSFFQDVFGNKREQNTILYQESSRGEIAYQVQSVYEYCDENYDRYPESDHSVTQSSASHDHLRKKPSTSTASEDTNKQEIPRLKKNKRTSAEKLRNEANKKHFAMCNQAIVYDNSDSDDIYIYIYIYSRLQNYTYIFT